VQSLGDLLLAGPAFGGGEGAVLLVRIVLHGMGTDEGALEEDLDGIPHHPYLHLPCAVDGPNAIAGTVEPNDAEGLYASQQGKPGWCQRDKCRGGTGTASREWITRTGRSYVTTTSPMAAGLM